MLCCFLYIFLYFNERQTSEYSQFSNYSIDRKVSLICRNLFVSGFYWIFFWKKNIQFQDSSILILFCNVTTIDCKISLIDRSLLSFEFVSNLLGFVWEEYQIKFLCIIVTIDCEILLIDTDVFNFELTLDLHLFYTRNMRMFKIV